MKTKSITLREYCERPVLMNRKMEIARAVQVEDMFNHRGVTYIPEMQNNTVQVLPKSPVIRNFFKSFIP